MREALRARRRRLHRLRLRAREGRPASTELADLAARAREAGVPAEELAPAEFDRAAPRGVLHQGVLLEVGPLPQPSLAGLVPPAPEPCWLLALDGVEDPQNLGALVRVADAAGLRGVVVPEHGSAPLSPAVARASAGALEHVPVARVSNLARSLNHLKSQGFWIHGADPAGVLELFTAPARLFDPRMVLVLGAEGRGLRPGVRRAIDSIFRIPMHGAVASLNVGTAAAVFLFEWRRRAAASQLP